MSFSQQTKRTTYHKPEYDLQYKELHWTKQLEMKPLRQQVRKVYEQGDSSTYFDMDRDPSTSNEQETT